MAAPSFQAWGSYLATLTSGTPGAPASVAQGDMLLLVAEDQGSDATSPTTASGGTETWTAHPSSPQFSSGATRLFVWWARASQASPTMPTVTAGNNHVFARVARFTGVKSSGDPWNGTEYAGSSNAAADGTIPGFTVGGADRLCVFLASTGYNGTNAARFSGWAENTTTVLTSLTEIHDQTDTVGGGGGFGGASALISSGGTTNGVDFTEAFAGHGMISLALSATADPTAQTLTGSTFTKAPTFPAATATPGEVSLTGSAFTKAPTFPTGEVTQPAAGQDLTGAVYQQAPTFPSSTVQTVYDLTGATLTSAPTFPAGTASPGAVSLSGAVFDKAPTFPQGSVSQASGAQDLTGSTFVTAPTFPMGMFTGGGVTSYRDFILAEGPVAYWRLGEPSGTVVNDETTNDNDGSYVNTPTLGVQGVIGDGNTAVDFNGTDEFVEVPDSPTLRLTDTCSFEMWTKVQPTLQPWPMLYGKGLHGLGMWLAGTPTGQFPAITEGGTATGVTSSVAVDDDEWHHVVGTKDGSDERVYVDGTDVSSGTPLPNPCTPNIGTPVQIAKYANEVNSHMNGVLDEVAVYDYVLSPQQVAEHFEVGPSVWLIGSTFTRPPTFSNGTISAVAPEQTLTGNTFTKAAMFPSGFMVGGAMGHPVLDALAVLSDVTGEAHTHENEGRAVLREVP